MLPHVQKKSSRKEASDDKSGAFILQEKIRCNQKSYKNSDVTIDVEEPKVEEKHDAIIEDPEVNDYEKIDEDLEELTPKKDVEKSEYEKVEDDDTLENDLFDLIDSMYDNREDGDI